MILRVEFIGFERIGGMTVKPGVMAMNSPPALDAPQVDVDQWHGETHCTAVMIRSIRDTHLHVRAFIRCYLDGGQVPKLLFFCGMTDLYGRLLEGNPIPVINKATLAGVEEGSPVSVVQGGSMIVRRMQFDAMVETPEQKIAICDRCPHVIREPEKACRLMLCCQKKTPEPERWRGMVNHDYGWCPDRRWASNLNERRALVRLQDRTMKIGDQTIQAIF